MSIISYTDFQGEQTIAGTNNIGSQQSIQLFIDEYEPEFLNALLGPVLAKEFVDGLVLVPVDPPTNPPTYLPIDPKWLFLRDETDLKQMIVCYVYYWYVQNATTTTTVTSEAKSANENSKPVSNWDKQVKAWNKMVKKARLFDLSTIEYPDYVRPFWNNWTCWRSHCPVNEIYYYKNTLNL